MMVKLEKDQQDVEAVKAVATKEKFEVQESFEEAQAIQSKANAELAEALPALDKALEVLSKLERSDFAEIAQYANPKDAIKYAMESVCVLLGNKPKKVQKDGQTVEDYLEEGRKMMNNSGVFIERLKDFKNHIDEIQPDTIKRLKKYIDWQGFDVPSMQKVSSACAGLTAYVIGMYNFYHVNLNVKPLRAKLAEAQERSDVLDAQLKVTLAKCAEAEEKLAGLKKQFDDAVNKKEELAFKVEDTAKCKERAQTLIQSLGGE